jgi:hypothetical protein
MMNLDDFNHLVRAIASNDDTKQFLYDKYGIDIYPLTENLEIALDIVLNELIPKEKIDYLIDMVAYDDLTDSEIEEAYNYIFNE